MSFLESKIQERITMGIQILHDNLPATRVVTRFAPNKSHHLCVRFRDQEAQRGFESLAGEIRRVKGTDFVDLRSGILADKLWVESAVISDELWGISLRLSVTSVGPKGIVYFADVVVASVLKV